MSIFAIECNQDADTIEMNFSKFSQNQEKTGSVWGKLHWIPASKINIMGDKYILLYSF